MVYDRKKEKSDLTFCEQDCRRSDSLMERSYLLILLAYVISASNSFCALFTVCFKALARNRPVLFIVLLLSSVAPTFMGNSFLIIAQAQSSAMPDSIEVGMMPLG